MQRFDGGGHDQNVAWTLAIVQDQLPCFGLVSTATSEHAIAAGAATASFVVLMLDRAFAEDRTGKDLRLDALASAATKFASPRTKMNASREAVRS